MAPRSSRLVKLAMRLLKRFTSPRAKISALRKDRGQTSVVRDLEFVVRAAVSGGHRLGVRLRGMVRPLVALQTWEKTVAW